MQKQETRKEADRQKLAVVAYKGKILLICEDTISTTPSSPVWGFLNRKNVNELLIKNTESTNLGPDLELLTLKDEHVNKLLRKEGYRFEFYKISELPKLKLTEATSQALSNLEDRIANLISS